MTAPKKKPSNTTSEVKLKKRSDNRTAKTNLDSTTEIVASLIDNLPIYQDALQPLAKQMGRTLDTLWGGINALLTPVAQWTYKSEQALEQYKKELVNELRLVPQERLITPSKVIAGPILESLKYAVDEPHLREMYAKLLATTMDAKTAGEAHPSFVDIIRQLTPDEARIVALFGKDEFFPAVTVRIHETKMEPEKVILGKHFVRADAADELISVSYDTIILEDFSLVPYDAGCAYPEKWPTYLNNLCRLNLYEFSEKKRFRMARQHWDTLYEHPSVIEARAEKTSEKSSTSINDSVIWVTAFGKQFYQACVQPHDTTDIEATVPLAEASNTSKPAKSRKRKVKLDAGVQLDKEQP